MTLSKEKLAHYAAHTEGPVKAMARELLERRERDKQEPVATAHRLVNKLTGSVQQWKFTPGILPASEGDTFQVEVLPLYAAPQSSGNAEQLEPVSQPYKLVGEVVAWDHPTKERKVDFRWLNYDVAPGTQLYAIPKERE